MQSHFSVWLSCWLACHHKAFSAVAHIKAPGFKRVMFLTHFLIHYPACQDDSLPTLPASWLGGNFEFKDKTVSCGCSLQAYSAPHTAAAIASPCCLSPFVIGRRLLGPQSRCMYLCSPINSAGDTASP